jgi:hypothetical protein
MTETKPRIRRHRRKIAGVVLPKEVDGRSESARAFRSLVKDYAGLLGVSDPSPADQALVRQAASFACVQRGLESDIAAGRTVDADTLIRSSSEHRRLLAQLQWRSEQIAEEKAKASRWPARRPDEATA